MIRLTIYEALKLKLGRNPTNAEIKADVKRILTEALIERAEAGKLAHQRKGRPKKMQQTQEPARNPAASSGQLGLRGVSPAATITSQNKSTAWLETRDERKS